MSRARYKAFARLAGPDRTVKVQPMDDATGTPEPVPEPEEVDGERLAHAAVEEELIRLARDATLRLRLAEMRRIEAARMPPTETGFTAGDPS